MTERPDDRETRIRMVLEGISTGQSLRKCLDLVGMSRSHWHDMVDSDPILAERYARARLEQAESLAERLEEAAMQAPGRDDRGRVDGAEVQHRRLIVDTLKWSAAHIHPARYGERQVIEHAGQVTLGDLLTQA